LIVMTTPYWKLLGISPTRDEDDIRRAYARRLKDFRPDEDPVGFQRLVGARDAALAWAEAAATSAPPRKRQIDKETREAEAGPRQTARNEDAAPPKTGPEMSLTSSSHQEEETAGDDGSPALEQEKPSDTVPDAVFDIVQPNGAKSPQLELEELVFVRLDEIMQPTKSGRMSRGVDAWDVRTWNDLFNQAAGLSLQSHKRFHDTIGRYLVYFLPEGRSRALEGLPDFSAARGVPAVIEAIEQECRFAEQPGKLAGLCTQDVAMTYFAWLATRSQAENSSIAAWPGNRPMSIRPPAFQFSHRMIVSERWVARNWSSFMMSPPAGAAGPFGSNGWRCLSPRRNW
jgi:curved DNA-binding protein CbpA